MLASRMRTWSVVVRRRPARYFSPDSMSELTLPSALGVAEGLRKGRSIKDGYTRGWGLEHGGLREKVLADALYQQCLALAQDRSVLEEMKRLNLFLLVRFYLGAIPSGHVVEFGAYRGGNAIFLAALCAAVLPGARVHAFDTFAGMPAVDKSVDAHNTGDFKDVDLAEVRQYVAHAGLPNLEFIPGRFEDTAARRLADIGPVALAHVDCDIRSGVACAYESVKPYMVDGGYIVFDDALAAGCLGALEAVEELVVRRDGLHAEQAYPHLVFRVFRGGADAPERVR